MVEKTFRVILTVKATVHTEIPDSIRDREAQRRAHLVYEAMPIRIEKWEVIEEGVGSGSQE